MALQRHKAENKSSARSMLRDRGLSYYMLGIKPVKPAFKEVIVEPYIPEGISELKGALRCPYGEIKVNYRKKDGKEEFKVILPSGVRNAANSGKKTIINQVYFEKRAKRDTGDKFAVIGTETNWNDRICPKRIAKSKSPCRVKRGRDSLLVSQWFVRKDSAPS